jgi:hypothetical protein
VQRAGVTSISLPHRFTRCTGRLLSKHSDS